MLLRLSVKMMFFGSEGVRIRLLSDVLRNVSMRELVSGFFLVAPLLRESLFMRLFLCLTAVAATWNLLRLTFAEPAAYCSARWQRIRGLAASVIQVHGNASNQSLAGA